LDEKVLQQRDVSVAVRIGRCHSCGGTAFVLAGDQRLIFIWRLPTNIGSAKNSIGALFLWASRLRRMISDVMFPAPAIPSETSLQVLSLANLNNKHGRDLAGRIDVEGNAIKTSSLRSATSNQSMMGLDGEDDGASSVVVVVLAAAAASSCC
jgi:hypothetical protein